METLVFTKYMWKLITFLCLQVQDVDLEDILIFQECFVEVITSPFESHFDDYGIVSCFKVLSPANVPAKQVGLKS
jgi:hypothetical protein